MQAVAQGDLSLKLRFRRRDYLHEEAALMGEMLEALRSGVGAAQEHGREAERALQALLEAEEQHDVEARREYREQLRERVDLFVWALDTFRIGHSPLSATTLVGPAEDLRPAEPWRRSA